MMDILLLGLFGVGAGIAVLIVVCERRDVAERERERTMLARVLERLY